MWAHWSCHPWTPDIWHNCSRWCADESDPGSLLFPKPAATVRRPGRNCSAGQSVGSSCTTFLHLPIERQETWWKTKCSNAVEWVASLCCIFDFKPGLSHDNEFVNFFKCITKLQINHCLGLIVHLTSMPSWMANMATWASGSASASACFSALAALAFPIFPRQTRATSSRCVFTHIRAMFSHTALLQRRERECRSMLDGILLFNI